jgi:hypothetical protein
MQPAKGKAREPNFHASPLAMEPNVTIAVDLPFYITY